MTTASDFQLLLVEDNPADAALFHLALRESHHGNFSILDAHRLSMALELVNGQPFDAVLLDLGLPDSQGLETLRRMRRHAPHTPIIVLTGHSDETLALPALQEGAQDYLVKGTLQGEAIGRCVRYVIERRRAEKASQEAERRLDLAVGVAKMGLWDWDLQTNEVVWSRIHASLLGVEGQPSSLETFDRCIYPEDGAKTLKLAAEAVANKQVFSHQYRVKWPDGSIHWIEVRARGLFDESGNATRMMGTSVDITARKQAEEERKSREIDFAHLARLSTINQLASGLAHELNQPLTAVTMYASICLTELQRLEGVPERLLSAMTELEGETRRATEIVSRMRAFVRKQQPRQVKISVNALIEETLGLLQYELGRAEISPEFRLDANLPTGVGDEVQLGQVLVNLITNAIQAMATIPVNKRRLTIRTEAFEKSGLLAVSVLDTGAGMPAPVKARLFEPFFTTKSNGMGLGLNISRSIIESHGGRLTASENAGGGMCFMFTLPLANEASICSHVSA